MPQMAPISWTILFILFSLSFIIFSIMNYFCYMNCNKMNNYENKNNMQSYLTWKW